MPVPAQGPIGLCALAFALVKGARMPAFKDWAARPVNGPRAPAAHIGRPGRR